MSLKRETTIIAISALINITLAYGQMKIGLDTYSRYVWRGLDFGNAASFQPYVSYSTGGFSLGAWGAFSISSAGGNGALDTVTYSITSVSNTFSENDLWVSYAYSTAAGTFTVYLTDYFYPSSHLKFFDYKDGGSHLLEAAVGYTGTESFPVTLAAYYNFFNDPDKSVYLQASIPFTIDSVYSATIFVGGTVEESAWYAASKANLINVGFTVSKTIVITESFSLPVSASYILNPEIEQSYLIFGISL